MSAQIELDFGSGDFQPYWKAWAHSLGRTPSAHSASGEAKGYLFIVWIGSQWDAWEAETGLSHQFDKPAFSEWLAAEYPAPERTEAAA